MRTIIAIAAIMTTFSAGAQQPTGAASGEELLGQGLTSYRAADYEDAVLHLDGAAQVFLSPEQMQNYVNTGTMANLDRLETALVYLALANAQLNREEEARQAVLRLMTAERIAPTYAALPLEADALALESLIPQLVPNTTLPRNTRLAALPRGSAPTLIAQATTPSATAAQPVQATPQPPPRPDPCAAAEQLAAQLLTERENRQRTIDAVVAQERARIERAADERVAAAERAAQEKIAAAERASEQRLAEQRVPAPQPPPPPSITVVRPASREYRSYLGDLRDAYAYAADRQLARANAIYNRLANIDDVPREILAEAAVGLYQTGAYGDAVRAFRRLGTFNRGDEDLRYYYAVALYETGDYPEAQREIACALPYIQVTDEVSRYRAKIQSASKQALR